MNTPKKSCIQIDLSNVALRQTTNSRDELVQRFSRDYGVVFNNCCRVSVGKLLELETILIAARKVNMSLTLPDIPCRYIRGRRFAPCRTTQSFARADGTALVSRAFSDFGMTVSLAASLDAETLTSLLVAFAK